MYTSNFYADEIGLLCESFIPHLFEKVLISLFVATNFFMVAYITRNVSIVEHGLQTPLPEHDHT